MFKKIISLMLALCLFATLFPLSVYAAGDGGDAPDGYARAYNFDDLERLNSDDGVEAIFIEPEQQYDLIHIERDITINKNLWIGCCDLVIEHGVTFTIPDYQQGALMSRGARVVCECVDAYPGCLGGGVLVLGETPVMGSDPDSAPINPTRDLVWMEALMNFSNPDAPMPPSFITVGRGCEADLHGDISGVAGISVNMDGDDAHITLTDDFTCGEIGLNGDVDLGGHTLSAMFVLYNSDCRIINYGEITGQSMYQYLIDMGNGETRYNYWFPDSEVYLENIGVPSELFDDESLLGWDADTMWEDKKDSLEGMRIYTDEDEQSDTYGLHYIVVPDFPIIFRARWDTVPVELTKYGATVAFDGIRGHEYSMVYIDSENTTDDELAGLGVSRDYVSNILDRAGEQLSDEGQVGSIFSFSIFDNDNNADGRGYELRIGIDEELFAEYDFVNLVPLRVEGDDVDAGYERYADRVEDGVLYAYIPYVEQCYALIYGNFAEITWLELSMPPAEIGMYTETPYSENEAEWVWRNQYNRPEIHIDGIDGGRGAYTLEEYWTLADDPDTPFCGEFQKGREYGLKVIVNAEPGYYFSDPELLELTFRCTYSYTVAQAHFMAEGQADSLCIRATVKPDPMEYYVGDVDDDGEVTILDATLIQRKLASYTTPVFIDEAADADTDGEITIIDVTAIQRSLANYSGFEFIGELRSTHMPPVDDGGHGVE